MKVLQYPHKALLTPAKSAFSILKADLDLMFALMEEHNGVALSANQVGLNAHFFITAWGQIFVNLRLLGYQGNYIQSREGCLSLPGTHFVRTRRERIVTSEGIFEGVKAIIIQHELDHLCGREVWHNGTL
jgi:peptide deformylase